MKKEIIFVIKALWIGGIENALINLLNQMDYEKYDVTLLILKAELDMVERIHPKCRLLIADRDKKESFEKKYKYSRLFHMTEKTSNPSKIHQKMMWTVPIIRWIENELYISYIRQMMQKEHFDTAVIYSDVVAETTIRAIKAEKYLMFYHHGSMRHVYHDKIAYRKCDTIVAVSKNLALELKKFVPQYANKIISIHNLIDIGEVRKKGKFSCKDVFEPEKFNIVSVGRVSYEKGMDIAVRACAKLVESGNENIRWWIVGGGPAMQEVQKIIKDLQMEKYVKMVGMQSNPYPYIYGADLYVQPSRVESFGLTIKEAMILGKRIVATNTVGASELITSSDDGILCEVDYVMLANAVEKEINSLVKKSEKNIAIEQFEEENSNSMHKLEAIL